MIVYEIKPIGGITVPGSSSVVIEIDAPNQSLLNKIIVQQVSGGVGSTFSLEFFNSENASQSLSESDSDSDEGGTGKIPPDCYKITPTLSGTEGYFEYINDSAGGYPVFSHDRSPIWGGKKKIWVRITNDAVAERVFAMALGFLVRE